MIETKLKGFKRKTFRGDEPTGEHCGFEYRRQVFGRGQSGRWQTPPQPPRHPAPHAFSPQEAKKAPIGIASIPVGVLLSCQKLIPSGEIARWGKNRTRFLCFSPGRPEKICAKRLLRFFFLRGCNFLDVSKAEFERVLDLINHRPRKRLNWRTLFDVFFGTVALA